MDIEEAIKIIKELIDGVEKYGYDFTVEESVVINKKEYKAIEVLLNELDKKDKTINEMAEMLVKDHEWFYSEFDNYTKQDFIDYFTKKAEGKI